MLPFPDQSAKWPWECEVNRRRVRGTTTKGHAMKAKLMHALTVMLEDIDDVGETLEGSHDIMPEVAAALKTVIDNYPIIEEYLAAYEVTPD